MMKWLVNSGWWLGNRHSPLRRGISFVFSLSSLVLLTACTDYVSKIEDQIEEMKAGLLLDSRDGQTYKIVTIGTQTWMAQNLNYETANSYCYDDDPSNCVKYGRLYTWAAAMNACPDGWHLPSISERNPLFTAVGGYSVAGSMLKSANGWLNGGNGADAYSFTALPAGGRNEGGVYAGEGLQANFWSSTGTEGRDADYVFFESGTDNVGRGGVSGNNAFSVRCIKD